MSYESNDRIVIVFVYAVQIALARVCISPWLLPQPRSWPHCILLFTPKRASAAWFSQM